MLKLDTWFKCLRNILEVKKKDGFLRAHEEMQNWKIIGTDKYYEQILQKD